MGFGFNWFSGSGSGQAKIGPPKRKKGINFKFEEPERPLYGFR